MIVVIAKARIELPRRCQFPLILEIKRTIFIAFFLVIKVRIVDAGMTELGPSKETVRIGKGHVLLSFYGPVHFVHMTVVIIVVVVPVSPQETAVFFIAVPVIHKAYVVGLFRHKRGAVIIYNRIGAEPIEIGIIIGKSPGSV